MLRLSDAAAKLGIAPSTLRAFADRGLIRYSEMPNGERRFDAEAVEEFRQAGASPPRAQFREQQAPPAQPKPRRPPWKDVPPWERPALSAEATIRIEKAKREIAKLEADDAAQALQLEREREAMKAAQQEQERLRLEAKGRERSENIARCMQPIAEAITTIVNKRREQAEEAAQRAAQYGKESAARLAALPEDRELESMEAAYQQRKALIEIARLARKMRR